MAATMAGPTADGCATVAAGCAVGSALAGSRMSCLPTPLGSRPEANGNGNCCTWWGKHMVVGAIGVKASDGKEAKIYGGFFSQHSANPSNVGKFLCYNQEFGSRRGRYSYQNVDFTTRVFRDGTIECWLGHNIAREGLPTRPADKRVATGFALGPDLQKAFVQKAGAHHSLFTPHLRTRVHIHSVCFQPFITGG